MTPDAGPSSSALDAILEKIALLSRSEPPSGDGPASFSSRLTDTVGRIENLTVVLNDATARLGRVRAQLRTKKTALRIMLDVTMRDEPTVKFAKNQRTKESRARAFHAQDFDEISRYEISAADLNAVVLACKAAVESMNGLRFSLQKQIDLMVSERHRTPGFDRR